eukprot:TRINITY_DN93537_c0_g1_i1.p1 TRINITY_DN93537_c0_g1~~TRINITY_DN93537_c0_g1_i1.p1  ORF type:complete len:444 (-),score=108.83 TRINITY_DN93537_c0_g1_i1:157-1488(-)
MAPAYHQFSESDGFFYVAIPADADKEMRQVFFPMPVTQNDDLSFIRALRAELGKEAPDTSNAARGDLFSELFGALNKENALPGIEPGDAKVTEAIESEKAKVKQSLAKVENHQLELLLTMREMEVITLRGASMKNDKKGMTLYHSKSAADQPVNERAIEILFAAGFPPKEVKGSCFLTCTEEFVDRDNLTPIWRRCDFKLEDCSTGATWVKEIREEREKSGAKERDEIQWMESLPKNDTPAYASGKTEIYAWSQTDEEVDIIFEQSHFKDIRATRQDITVKFKERSLYVRLRGKVLVNNLELFGQVDPWDCCWTFDQASHELQVTLIKAENGQAWGDLGKAKKPKAAADISEVVIKPGTAANPTAAQQASEASTLPLPVTSTLGGSKAEALRRRSSWPKRVLAAVVIGYYAMVFSARHSTQSNDAFLTASAAEREELVQLEGQ